MNLYKYQGTATRADLYLTLDEGGRTWGGGEGVGGKNVVSNFFVENKTHLSIIPNPKRVGQLYLIQSFRGLSWSSGVSPFLI
jgi:hypothetical protein